MKRIVLGAAVGSVVIFIWGFLFWGVLPFGNQVIGGAADPAAAQQALAEIFDETGAYMVPFAEDPNDATFQTLHKAGPIAFVHYRAEGSEPMAPGTFLMGLAHGFVVLLVMGLAISTSDAGFGGRVLLVVLAGLAGSLFAELASPIWWLTSWSLAITNVIYQAIAWLLGGIALAWIVQKKPDTSAM